MVTGLEMTHPGADGLDDAGGFVTEDEGHGERDAVAVQRVHIAVAHARGDDPDEDLSDPRCVDLHVLDGRGAGDGFHESSAHGVSMARAAPDYFELDVPVVSITTCWAARSPLVTVTVTPVPGAVGRTTASTTASERRARGTR